MERTSLQYPDSNGKTISTQNIVKLSITNSKVVEYRGILYKFYELSSCKFTKLCKQNHRILVIYDLKPRASAVVEATLQPQKVLTRPSSALN